MLKSDTTYTCIDYGKLINQSREESLNFSIKLFFFSINSSKNFNVLFRSFSENL